ncbi:MAG: ABC transporter ATP-binding protein [Flavobacterium sp.]|jgi:ABC-type sulfate/molybdate transport systems ATPase subunit
MKTLNNISFSVGKGQHVSILGESGSGKSTLLKLIYGLYDVDDGEIFWNKTKILGPKYNLVPGMSFMKYLAQDFDLMPFITVSENIGKFLSNFYPEKKQTRINELLQLVEMTEFSNVKVKYLSGGQMQRVAIARVLALEPEILLFDEPFSHIDNSRKNNLRRSVFNYAKDNNITCIVATHDINDALSFSDKIIVLKKGELIIEKSPELIYNNPSSYYIASLFGEVNEIKINSVSHYVYPHELKVDLNFDFEVCVKKSYFKGSHFLIEAEVNKNPFFFEHNSSIDAGVIVGLKIKKDM